MTNHLKVKIDAALSKTPVDKDRVYQLIDEYEKENLIIIERLQRTKKLTTRKISGGLKSCINAHGPITKDLIGSATKRIYGNLLEPKKVSIFKKIINKLFGRTK